MAFVFYDTETTGLNWAFDQILQFAAVRTDAFLQPIDEAQFQSRLLPHVVPSPEAMRVNGMTPERLDNPTLPSHYNMVCAINGKLRGWGPSMYMGFNSFGLDENMLRAAFYKTLHRPYLTVMDNNSRSDILRVARAVALLAPGTLRLPISDYDTPIFRLSDLARTNGFNDYKAHDARGDIDATLHIARILMNEAPSIWNDFMRFAKKSTVLQHIQDETIFGLAEFYKGRPYSWLVTHIGTSNTPDKNIHYAFDLQFDPDELAALSDEELIERLDAMPRPVKKFRVNGCPIIFPVEDAPAGTEARFLDDAELERRALRLRNDPFLRQRLIAAREATLKVWPKSPFVERQLFDEFTGDNDLPVLEQFHAAPWADRLPLLGALRDGRIRELGEELIYLESPQSLPPPQQRAHAERHRRRVLGLDGFEPWLTIPGALEEIDFAIALASSQEQPLLLAHRAQLLARRESLAMVAA